MCIIGLYMDADSVKENYPLHDDRVRHILRGERFGLPINQIVFLSGTHQFFIKKVIFDLIKEGVVGKRRNKNGIYYYLNER